jgi:L-amino acid N-acyltransferase YncA
MIAIRAARPEDAAAIAAIYAPYVLTGTVSFESDAPDARQMRTRMAAQSAAYAAAQNPVAAPPADAEAAASNVVEAAVEASNATVPTTGVAEGRTNELPLEDDVPPAPTPGNTQ